MKRLYKILGWTFAVQLLGYIGSNLYYRQVYIKKAPCISATARLVGLHRSPLVWAKEAHSDRSALHTVPHGPLCVILTSGRSSHFLINLGGQGV